MSDRVLQAISAGPIGGQVGHELHMSHGGFDIASLSLGGVLAAVEAVMAGEVSNAYALVRPPGHHAEADAGHGFCVFSNVSLAAAHALERLGASRVAVVDWDVHHGAWACATAMTCTPRHLRQQRRSSGTLLRGAARARVHCREWHGATFLRQ